MGSFDGKTGWVALMPEPGNTEEFIDDPHLRISPVFIRQMDGGGVYFKGLPGANHTGEFFYPWHRVQGAGLLSDE